VKRCPKCSAPNLPDAWLCSCGYEFKGGEPHLESRVAKADSPSGQFPVFTLAAVLTLVSAIVVYFAAQNRISELGFAAAVFTLVLAFLGFASFLFCARILFSSSVGWGTKLVSILFFAFGLVLLGSAIVYGGCTSGIFKFRMN